MKNILIALISILAIAFLATQVLAWTHGYGHRGLTSFARSGDAAVCLGWNTAQHAAGYQGTPGYRGSAPGHRPNEVAKPYRAPGTPTDRSLWNGPHGYGPTR